MAASKNKAIKLPRIQLEDYPCPDEYDEGSGTLSCFSRNRLSEDPCPSCPGHCCALLLSLTVHDVARIAVGLSLAPGFYCHLEKRTEEWNSPPVDIEGAQYTLMLRSGGFDLENHSTHECVFLHNIDGHRRCAIYGLRPMTCRLYPFKWQQGKQMSGPKVVWCPQGWLVSSARRRQLVRVIKKSLVEEAESQRAIHAFNRQARIPHTIDGFFRYAIQKGSDYLGLDPTCMLAPPTRRGLGKRLW